MSDGEHVGVFIGYLLWRNLYARSLLTFKLDCLSGFCFLPCSGSSAPIRQIISKYTMPSQDYTTFHSVDDVPSCPKSLSFDVVKFAYF